MYSNVVLLFCCLCVIPTIVLMTDPPSSPTPSELFAKENLVTLTEMVLFPKMIHPLVIGNYESFSDDVRKEILQFYSRCSLLGVQEPDMRKIEAPLLEAISIWFQNQSKDNELEIQRVVENAEIECDISSYDAAPTVSDPSSNSLPPIGSIYVNCERQMNSGVPLLQENMPTNEEMFIWDLEESFKKMLPIKVCARLLILENILLRLFSHNKSSYYFIRRHHVELIEAIQKYSLSTKSSEDVREVHAVVYNAFKDISAWTVLRYRETRSIKASTDRAGKPEALEIPIDYQSFIEEIPKEAAKNFKKTWNILTKALTLPLVTDPVVLGNLELIPDITVELIRDIYEVCSDRTIGDARFKDLQLSIAKVIFRWKTDHNKYFLEEALTNLSFLNRMSPLSSFDINESLDYSSIEKTTVCNYNKNIDSGILNGKVVFSEISDVISSLPPESCVRIAIINTCISKSDKHQKSLFERQIFEAVQTYVRDKNVGLLNYTLVEIQFKIVAEFEKMYAAESQRTAVSLPSDIEMVEASGPSSTDPLGTTVLDPSQQPVAAPALTHLLRSRSRRSRGKTSVTEGTSSVSSSDTEFSFDYLVNEAVDSPRNSDRPHSTSGRRNEENLEPATPQSREKLSFPVFVYSDILVSTLHMDYKTQLSIGELYDCLKNEVVPEHLLTDGQNVISVAVQKYKNGSTDEVVIKAVMEETNGCFTFVTHAANYDIITGSTYSDMPSGSGSSWRSSERF